jgi:hypothetical protein
LCSFGVAYGFIYLVHLGTDFREENRKFGVISDFMVYRLGDLAVALPS